MRQSKDPLERYDTPAWMTRAMWDTFGHCINKQDDLIEPCAGSGAIIATLAQKGILMDGFDIEPRHDAIVPADTIDPAWWDANGRDYDGMVTNPPFSRGTELLQAALPHVKYAIMLVRLNFLEYVGNRKNLPSPKAVVVLPRMRPWFTGNKTDSVSVCWAFWSNTINAEMFPMGIRCYNKQECQQFLECGDA